MRYKTMACLFLVVVTFCVYWPVRNNGFIIYDDPAYVTGNEKVKAGLNAASILWAFTSAHSSNWHPLAWLSHMLDVQLFGIDPRWHHLTNLFLHLANTVLLFLLLSKMTASYWKSLFVAALFALHPLHVESVAWVSERKDVLSTFFFLLTLIFYYRYVKYQSRLRYLFTLGAFALGLMSKPMLVTLPFVLLLMDYWPLGRVGFSQAGSHAEGGTDAIDKKDIYKRLVWEKIPFFVLSVASSVITIYAQGKAVATLKGVSLIFRCVNALLAYVYYIGKMFWPYNLAVIYPLPPQWTIVQGVEAGLLLAGMTAFSVLTARRHPYLLVGWFWYLGTLVPVIGLVQVGRQFIADRYTYIPLIGIFIMVAWGVPNIVRDSRYKKIVLSSLAGLILLASSVGSWFQVGYWKDSITLFRHATEAFPDNHIARNILGNALSDAGRIEEAISQFSQVLQVWPKDAEALIGIGTVFAKQGRNEEALRYFEEVLRINPDSADAHFQVGLQFAERGKIEECIYHFTKVLQINPEDVEAHHNLGVALVKQGKLDEAIYHFNEALRVKPDQAEAARSLQAAVRLKKHSDGR